MASYYIHMDQGLVVDLRHHTLCSGQFSNCAPIVFYNANSHYGGLYHLGGCKKLNEMKTNHLRLLETVVRPTVIYVLAGADADDPFFPARGHVGPVSALFQDVTVNTDFSGRSSYSSITVSETLGVLNIAPGYSMDNKLNKRARIDALPDEVGFIGEKDEAALGLWL
jgi:hypothetical protein